eukprot:4014032-Prymnesium_polylepis.1
MQGQNFVCTGLLRVLPEEEAFWLLVVIVHEVRERGAPHTARGARGAHGGMGGAQGAHEGRGARGTRRGSAGARAAGGQHDPIGARCLLPPRPTARAAPHPLARSTCRTTAGRRTPKPEPNPHSPVCAQYLPDHYTASMVGSVRDTKVLSVLVQQQLPVLAEHLRSLDTPLQMITARWYLCLWSS